jgi:SAM-dependent methyltransferase
MPLSVEDVRDHYEGLSFGAFCYGDRRAGYYPLVDDFLEGIEPTDLVYDVGCGAGFWLDEFVRRGVREDQLLGIDLAPSHVLEAQRRGHRAVCGNVLDLAVPSDSAGFTFCAGVIHHTPDPARALAELARVTRSGGRVYLAVYNRWHPYFWMVHRATTPLRALHWRGWRRTSAAAYRVWKFVVQPIARCALRQGLDEPTCRALYMDQVLTPYAHLFTVAGLARQADRAGLDVLATRHALCGLMIVSLLQVRQKT